MKKRESFEEIFFSFFFIFLKLLALSASKSFSMLAKCLFFLNLGTGGGT